MDSTKTHPTRPARRIHDKQQDQEIFSETADRTHSINTLSNGRPMRGGIRL